MRPLRHRLLRASAGTGKTYRLARHFLGLLLRGVPPERVLATTFTRKAAGEILERVLGWLVEAAGDDERGERQRAALAEEVGRDVGPAECAELLQRLARRLDRFHVLTLDAFFARVARLFALDLGLPGEWRVADEVRDRELRAEALGAVLAEAGREEWIPLLRALHRGDAARRVHEAMLDTVQRARETWLECAPGAWEVVRAPAAPSEAELDRACELVQTLDVPRNKNGSPKKHWENARLALVDAIAAEDWERVPRIGLAAKVAEGAPTFDRAPIPDELRDALGVLLRRAVHEVVAKVVAQNAATTEFLARFERAYVERKERTGELRFDDLPRRLAPPGDGSEEDLLRRTELAWRLDTRVDHLLLDEFQDTAPAQWRILAGLAEELLATGDETRSFFCVGDVKQSIYGWRGGDPRLFEVLERMPQLEHERLAKSYRSSPVVLDFVNRVFGGLLESELLSAEPAHRAAAAAWLRGFAPHEAAHRLPGTVVVHEAFPPEPDEDPALPALLVAAARAAALAAESPDLRIGILVRSNKPIPRLVYLLREEGVHASQEGGNPLTDSAAVLHALSLLHLADHPDDTLAAFHVATSPLAEHAGLDPEALDDDERRRAVARGVRARLVAEGYGPWCAELRAAVAERYGAWDRRRLGQLVDLAFAFDERAELRPSAFVDLVREQRVEDPSSSRVQVMTVHAAKGLEFDAVLLPELNGPLYRPQADLLTHHDDPTQAIASASHAPPKDACALAGEPLCSMREAWMERGATEALSVFYVALTRARSRLELVLRPPSKTEVEGGRLSSLTYANLVRDALGLWPEAAEVAAEREGPLFSVGELDEDEPTAPAAPAATNGAARPAEREPAASGPLALLPGARVPAPRSPSAEEGGPRRRGAELLRAPAGPATRRGSLVHRWLQEVEWLEDFAASDAELDALGAELEPDAAARATALAELRAALARPGAREVLGRRDGALWRERRFCLLLADPERGEELWTGAFDRAVVGPDGAEVVDFKTDRVEGAALEERARHYAPQLAAYRRALAELTGLAEERVRARLWFVDADRVWDLPG